MYYEYDTRFGNIKPQIKNSCSRFTFSVLTEFNSKEKIVLNENAIELFAIPENTEHINLRIKDRFGEEINRHTIDLVKEKAKFNTEEIQNLLNDFTLKQYRQVILKKIVDAEPGRYCFVFPSILGFELYAITIKKKLMVVPFII